MNIWSNFIILLILNRIFISIFININFSLKKIFACSTSFYNILIIFIYLINFKQFFIFSILYSINLYFLLNLLIKFNNRKIYIIFNYKSINFIFKLWILIYSILPFFFRFLLKWNFIFEIIKFNKFLSFIFFIFLISNLLLLWKYLIILKKHIYINNKKIIYLKINIKINIYIIIIILIFIFLFILINFLNFNYSLFKTLNCKFKIILIIN